MKTCAPSTLFALLAFLVTSNVHAATFVSQSIPFYGNKMTSSMDVSSISMDSPFPADPPQTMPASTKQKRTLYEVLGASPTDSKAELKQSYLKLAKQAHPDARRSTSSQKNDLSLLVISASHHHHQHQFPQTVSDFSEITAAWSILGDPVERRKYDQSLQVSELSDRIATVATGLAELTVVVVVAFGRLCRDLNDVWMQAQQQP